MKSCWFKYIQFPTLGGDKLMLDFGYGTSKYGQIIKITKGQAKDQSLGKTGRLYRAAIVKQ